jgi:hypothetical protein
MVQQGSINRWSRPLLAVAAWLAIALGSRGEKPTELPVPSLSGAGARSGEPASPPVNTVHASLQRSLVRGLPPLWSTTAEHPLTPVLRWAKQGLPAIEKLKDYSATLVRRERIRGALSGYERLSVKIRHTPFSVYVGFEAPANVKGQEAIYVAGRNQGNLLAHKARVSATISLLPEGMIAMTGRHYPLTEIGLVNLVHRLIEVGERDVRYGECEVNYYAAAKVDHRPCTVIEVVHPVSRDTFRYHVARIFVDDQLKMPIRYESYDWPREPGGAPQLIEEYTYLNLKLNCGFTDEDFSVENPAYGFR